MSIHRLVVGPLLLLLATHSMAWGQANESSPATVVERVLNDAGIDAALEKFQELTTTGGADFVQAENDFIALGEQLLADGRTIAAMVILEQIVESYPDSWRVYRLLSGVYNRRGNLGAATRYFQAFMDKRAEMALIDVIARQGEQLATTAEQVIARCVEAMGGEYALRSLRTLKMTSTGYQMAGPFGGVRLMKAPNYLRQQYGDGTSATVTDGITVWSVSPAGWREQTPTQAWQQAFSITLDVLDYHLKGITYELVGTEAVEGATLYKVRKTLNNGDAVFVYFDIASGLLVMESDSVNGFSQSNLFFDYRDVAGVQLPHMRVRVAEILKTPHIAIIEYEANLPLDESLFVRPE